MKIFVYGTLRRGEGNHGLLGDSEFLGEARTWEEYTMLHLGGFPGVVAEGGTPIKGEVYEVDDQTLARLDILEGHPTFYRRRELYVLDDFDQEIRCQTYLLPMDWLDQDYRQIESGDWRDR